MKKYGIEKIRVYPTSLQLSFETLARARGFDPLYVQRELMVDCRGLNPGWEDPVTMAVNAAQPMLTPEDIDRIGLLVIATETGLDQEKSISSWVLRFLGLPTTCRHFEVKTACYSGTAALKIAISFLASGIGKTGQKALVITTDESLNSLFKPWEYVLGAGAVAMLVSDTPDFLEIELDKAGVYSHEVTDVIRPLPWLETGNSELSLFSYMEALVGAYEEYRNAAGPVAFTSFFQYQVYHVPFGGISYRAHKQLMDVFAPASKAAIRADFQRRVSPSLSYARRIGATYGGSVFLAMLGIIASVEEVRSGDRIGIYSYGSGSCAEFYSGLVGPRAKAVALAAALPQSLEARFEVSVESYEHLEKERDLARRSAAFTPDFGSVEGLYESRYRGRNLLTYRGSNDYYRRYEYS